MTELTFNLGVNRLFPGIKLPPGAKEWPQYTHSFHTETHTVQSFMDLIKDGFAFSPTMKNSHRMKSNFISAQHIVLDFDNGDATSDLATLLADDFIRQKAAFAYSTPSSTPQEPRSRVVFVLSEPEYEMEAADKMMRAMVERFPTSDQTVGEASRFLYGANRETGIVIPIGNILDLEEAKKLVPPEPPKRTAAPPRQRTYRPAPEGRQYTVLEIIAEYAPREVHQNANPRSRWTLRCPVCHEYVAAETDSFSVHEDNNQWLCFACGERGTAQKLLQLLGGAPTPDYYPPHNPVWDDENPFDQVEEHGEEDLEEIDEWELPEDFSQRPTGTCFISSKQVRFRSWVDGVREFLDLKKAEFIEALPERTEAQVTRKRNIRLCWDNYKRMRCKNTGEIYLQRYRCGEATCPVCAIWLAEEFFTGKDDDGRNRMDILKEQLHSPTLFLIYLGSLRFPDDPIEAGNLLARQQKRIVNMDKHLKDTRGSTWDIAQNHIRGIRIKMEGDVVHYQLVMVGNHEMGVGEMLEHFFSDEMGLAVRVREVVVHGLNDLKDRMIQLMALRCDWDTVGNYQLWRAATKGARLIQGVGSLYKVSGSKAPKQLRMKLAECKVCGACEPVDLGGVYPVATTNTIRIDSWGGGKYTALVEDHMLPAMAVD